MSKLTEWELESAICQYFPLLLPDLHQAGYKIVSRQAVLYGRRLDLFLENKKNKAFILELKVGNPKAQEVCKQILGYENCFKKSSHGSPVRLMVISNKMTEQTKCFIEERNIETKVIEDSKILKVLAANTPISDVEKSKKLDSDNPDEVARIRYLLSDFSKIAKPVDWQEDSPWSHEKVFFDLCNRREKHKDLWKKDIYVQFYPQQSNAAILYHPDTRYVDAPIHLNQNSKGWDGSKFEIDENVIAYVKSDNKGKGNHNFDHYKILDWEQLAKQLGLTREREI